MPACVGHVLCLQHCMRSWRGLALRTPPVCPLCCLVCCTLLHLSRIPSVLLGAALWRCGNSSRTFGSSSCSRMLGHSLMWRRF